MGVIPEVEQTVCKRVLIGHIALKANGAVNGLAGRNEQVILVIYINDSPEVKCRSDIGEVCLVFCLVINLRADRQVG